MDIMESSGAKGKQQRFDNAVRLGVAGLAPEIWSLEEFDVAVNEKIQVPSDRYAHFHTLDEDTLAVVTVTYRQASDRVQRALKMVMNDRSRVDKWLEEFGPHFYSQDHGWRDLMLGLAEIPSHYDLKVLGLTKYRRYLLNCLDALNSICCNRLQSAIHGDADSDSEEETLLATMATNGATLPEPRLRSAEVIVRDLIRLPRGRTAQLMPPEESSMEVWLGKRRFRIETWDTASFVDDSGRSATLREGRNLIGRALYNDVVVHAEYVDVSRSHLILDIHDGRPAGITDVSSGGTFVSRGLIVPEHVSTVS